jgi:hypothetical protein
MQLSPAVLIRTYERMLVFENDDGSQHRPKSEFFTLSADGDGDESSVKLDNIALPNRMRIRRNQSVRQALRSTEH